jgi:hypothetical protein
MSQQDRVARPAFGRRLRVWIALLALILLSIVLALGAAEGALALLGRYDDAVARTLVPADTIWERPPDTVQFQKHPDLDYNVRVVFDHQGVRNEGPVQTAEKKHILGFFGDSFTENRRVDDELSFTSILGSIAERGRSVVNFGVNGYGVDQAYLHYLKYADLDIDHVFFVFYSNDLRNLYETDLAVLEDGKLSFRKPQPNRLVTFLGKLRLTYLAVDSYNRISALFHPASADFSPEALQRELSSNTDLGEARDKRYHDEYADSVVRDFLSDTPTQPTRDLAAKFVAVLDAWKAETASRGRAFTIVVLPGQLETALARKMELEKRFDTVYLRSAVGDEGVYFKNDDHWNELGNLKAALALAQEPRLQAYFRPADLPAVQARYEAEIKSLYANHKAR